MPDIIEIAAGEVPPGLAIVVNGGRDYADCDSVYLALDRLRVRPGGLAVVIHGAAPGADELAAKWADERGVPVEAFPADWALGLKAGPLRNRAMIERVKAWPRHGLVSFPGGRGTRGTRAIATELGVPVWLPAGE